MSARTLTEADVTALVDRRLAERLAELGLLPSSTPKPPRPWSALEPHARGYMCDRVPHDGWTTLASELRRHDAVVTPADLDAATLEALRTDHTFPGNAERHLPREAWGEWLATLRPLTDVRTEHEVQARAALIRHAETLAVVPARLTEQERQGRDLEAAHAIGRVLTQWKFFVVPEHVSAAAASGIRKALARGLLATSKHLPADAWRETASAAAPKGAA